MLHDPSGKSWPACSLLIVGFDRRGRVATDDERKGAPKEYLGRKYEPRIGSVELPPRSLSEWSSLGEIETIYYVRPGTKAPGKYFHDFGKRRLRAFFKKGKATLYRRGSAYRVELGRGCIAHHDGIVFP
jgi:hypothetical protein